MFDVVLSYPKPIVASSTFWTVSAWRTSCSILSTGSASSKEQKFQEILTPWKFCDDDDDDDEIAYFTMRWKTRASFVYRTKNMR